ncbi:MAG: pyridoxamine 5'-phosphate oxidase family protein [Synergistaceae bacterium]
MKTMIPEKMIEVLKHEGVVSIVTQDIESHVVNTWNSYLKIIEGEKVLIPAGGMNTTEGNLKENSRVLMTLGSREVEGFHSMGTGFLIEGIGRFFYEGEEFDQMKEKFPWMRAILVVKINNVSQTL